MCADVKEGKRSVRGAGRCMICRVSLCEEHFVAFHDVEEVVVSSKKRGLDLDGPE